MYNNGGWSYFHTAKQLSSLFIKYPNIKNIIEIGSLTGTCSTTMLGLYAKGRGGKLICVDICFQEEYEIPKFYFPEDTTYPLNKGYEQFIENIKHNGIEDIIETFSGDSDKFFSEKKYENIDLIFIDGFHSYEQTKRDILNSKSLYPNAIICGDDFSYETVKSAVLEINKDAETEEEFWRIQ